jgi:hypothetical protein
MRHKRSQNPRVVYTLVDEFMAVGSSLEVVVDPLPAIAGIVAVARASDAMAVRAVRFRRAATLGVSSI